MHDRRIPRTRANIDHLAVAPSGVWVIDAKRYTGKISVSKPLFGAEKLTIGGRDRTKLVDGCDKQVALVAAAVADEWGEVPVHGALCFVDGDLPALGTLRMRGHVLVHPRGLAKRLNAKGTLAPEHIRSLAALLGSRFPSA